MHTSIPNVVCHSHAREPRVLHVKMILYMCVCVLLEKKTFSMKFMHDKLVFIDRFMSILHDRNILFQCSHGGTDRVPSFFSSGYHICEILAIRPNQLIRLNKPQTLFTYKICYRLTLRSQLIPRRSAAPIN